MRAYVGVTDGDWYRSLAARGATEVNFWQPSGARRFSAVDTGAPFLFKTHAREGSRIVGGGFLSGWAALSVRQAWDLFGLDNGTSSLDELLARVDRYRRSAVPADSNHEIGCVMLRDVVFVSPDESFPAPPDWASNIVQGRTYDLATAEGSYVEDVLAALLQHGSSHALFDRPSYVPGPVFGPERLVSPRVGQRAFKALVQEAYGKRCAITGDRILPVLEAAHIRPVSAEGQNRVDNGLFLRSDVHTLFDQGYLGVHPVRRTLMVSPRLRSEWGNGEEFYQRERSAVAIRIPARRADRPSTEFLEWHADSVFRP